MNGENTLIRRFEELVRDGSIGPGSSATSVASMLKCSYAYARKLLNQYGLAKPDSQNPQAHRRITVPKDLLELYAAGKITLHDISTKVGCSYGTAQARVSEAIQRQEIERPTHVIVGGIEVPIRAAHSAEEAAERRGKILEHVERYGTASAALAFGVSRQRVSQIARTEKAREGKPTRWVTVNGARLQIVQCSECLRDMAEALPTRPSYCPDCLQKAIGEKEGD